MGTIYLVLWDATPKRLSMVLGSFSSLQRLMTDVKILDQNGNKLVKPPILYGDAIIDDTVTAIAQECHWLWEVDGRQMFLPIKARCFNAFDLQCLSIARIMSENISKYQENVVFGRIDCRGGRSKKTNTQPVGLLM